MRTRLFCHEPTAYEGQKQVASFHSEVFYSLSFSVQVFMQNLIVIYDDIIYVRFLTTDLISDVRDCTVDI